MGLLKKQLFWVLCGVVVLLAGGMFIAAAMVNLSNEDELRRIKKACGDVSKLGSKAKRVNRTELDQLKANCDDARDDAEQVSRLALQTAQRPLLYEDYEEIFPQLKAKVEAQYHYGKFADRYTELIQNVIRELRAGDRPSELEEKRVAEYQQTDSRRQAGKAPIADERFFLPGGRPGRTSASRAQQEEKLKEDLRRQRAQEISIYATVGSFCGYDYWQAHPLQDDDTMLVNSWFTQIAAWVQEDVVGAILEVNGSSKAGPESPIKRLIEISFAGQQVEAPAGVRGGATRPRRSVKNAAGRRDYSSINRLPSYVISQDEAPIGNLVTAYTQHACNKLFDVVHFETAVIIDTTRIADFINALQGERSTELDLSDDSKTTQKRSQITILEVQVESIDINGENAEGYYYGDGSLAVLRLVAEYVFFKNESAYEQLKPKPVKESLEAKEQEEKTTSIAPGRKARDKGKSEADSLGIRGTRFAD